MHLVSYEQKAHIATTEGDRDAWLKQGEMVEGFALKQGGHLLFSQPPAAFGSYLDKAHTAYKLFQEDHDHTYNESCLAQTHEHS